MDDDELEQDDGLAALRVEVVAGALAAQVGARHLGQRVDSFTVRTKWLDDVYAPGDRTTVAVTVLRPGPEQLPSDPPTYEPAEGVEVTTSLLDFFPPRYGIGVTNSDGKTKIHILLPRDFEGKVDTYTQARMVHNRGGALCTEVEEYGYEYDRPAFVVR